MATGYTRGVEDGSVTTLKEFALECAHAFGALADMRDTPIPDSIEVDAYYPKRLKDAELELAELESLTTKEIASLHQKEMSERAKRNAKYIQDHKLHRQRHESMLSKVQAWQPPTEEHDKLKNFMIEQLTISFDFESSREPFQEAIQEMEEWYQSRIAAAKRSLRIANENHEREVRRTRISNEWLCKLRESLE